MGVGGAVVYDGVPAIGGAGAGVVAGPARRQVIDGQRCAGGSRHAVEVLDKGHGGEVAAGGAEGGDGSVACFGAAVGHHHDGVGGVGV